VIRSATAARSGSMASASKDETAHPMFRPLVNVQARIYDMQHDSRFVDALSYCQRGGRGLCGRPQAATHARRLVCQTRRGRGGA
jgi:hypothetical protein